jgi:hypothetical protein
MAEKQTPVAKEAAKTQPITNQPPQGVPQGAPQGAPGAPQVETASYVPTYRVKPEFKQEILKAIGDRPFNEIAGLMNAINAETIDHNTLTQILNVLGKFPYTKVMGIMANVNSFIEQIIED